MIISNPPYIPTAEIEDLMDEVKLHDPRMALDGMEDGLYFYRAITKQAQDHLVPGGWLLYEIGCSQGEDVAALLRKYKFEDIEIRQDLAGLDRVVLGRKKLQEVNMFDKLDDLLIRFEEVLNELGEPGVTDNQEHFQKL